MADTILGRVAICPRGEYNELTTYDLLDLVTEAGGSYLSKISGNTFPLTNTNAWMVIASKCDRGAPRRF